MVETVRIPDHLVPAYREKQTARLLFNLRVASVAGSLTGLFYIFWELRRDPEDLFPGVELLLGLSGFLIILFALTFLFSSHRALGIVTFLGMTASICAVVWAHTALSDLLSGTGVLLLALIATTILAVDLSKKVIIVLLVTYLAVPNFALALSDAPRLIVLDTNWILIPGLFLSIGMAYMLDRANRESFLLEYALGQEKSRADELLATLLPQRVADRLMQDLDVTAEVEPDATVLFADLVGFTSLTRKMPPDELINLLSGVFTTIDALVQDHGLEKIKTVGDAYMVAAGVADASGRTSADMAEFAMESIEAVRFFVAANRLPLDLRVGMATGPVISGVIGLRKPYFDLWGHTVNLASRLESTAPAGGIHVDAATAHQLEDCYVLEKRGKIELKGIGTVDTYLLLGRQPVQYRVPGSDIVHSADGIEKPSDGTVDVPVPIDNSANPPASAGNDGHTTISSNN